MSPLQRNTTTSFDAADLRETQMNASTATRLSTGFLAAAALAALMVLMLVGSARADLAFDEVSVELNQPPKTHEGKEFDFSCFCEKSIQVPDVNPDGTFVDPQFDRQAGGHPDLTVYFKVEGRDSDGAPAEAVRSLVADLPPGMVGDPTGTPTCTPAALSNPGGAGANCPVESQVGVAEVRSWGAGGAVDTVVGIFNIAHGTDVPARFGFNFVGVLGLITAEVDPTDYSISSGSLSASQGQAVESVRATIWGVPADPAHDTLRQGEGAFVQVLNFNTPAQTPIPSPGAPAPVMTAPPRCSADPLEFTIRGDSWENPGKYAEQTFTADPDGTPFVMSGCERVPFNPSADVTPLTHAADSPTGLEADIEVPQPKDPNGIASAHVRKVKMTFPEGMSVNAASAAGLGACSLAEIKLHTNEAPSCPDSSKLGKITIQSPLLEESLQGDVILAKPYDNPFNSLLALYIAVKGPGFYLKLPGKIDTDPDTGQVSVVFDENPQLPFESLHLEMAGGPRASLSTPKTCGTYNLVTEFTSWKDDVPVTVDSPFVVDQACGGGFSPGFQAGTVNPTAGAYSPFVLRLTRNDGEQSLAKLSATLPQGLLAKLAGVPLCGDAQAATGDCPAGSQVGTVTVGTGSGPTPLYVPEAGKAPTAAYLAGPYKGAPYSMVVKVPAQAGPFDLGTVAVRNALNVDPITAQVTAVSDPLPQILQGIPIAYRDVRVEVNRPEFTINPTSCKPKQITSVLTSTTGQTASPSAGFKASECGELGFGPSLKIALKGKMKRTGNPALTAVLKAPKGDANLAKTTVILPKSEFIDNEHINNPCTRVQFNADACPASSILGTATATSPLIDKPLTGPVYFRSNGGERELPDLVADLDGPIHVTVVGFIDSVKGSVRTRFANIPDAPVSKFTLKMKGGKKGLLANSRDLCSFTPRAKVQMTGQNGKTANSSVKLGTSCGGGKRKK